MVLDELARKIRAQREKRGLKQQDVANALRLSPQAVSKWERGENAPDIAVLAPLANLLGVTTDWLLSTGAGLPDVFEATVLVSSVQGAYRKSRNMKPRDFATWANGLFYMLTEVTLRQGAVPIKYMGDQYLCFFSGPLHQGRALEAALAASEMVAEDLRIALGSGEIYLGAMGHPDYARPDIMGEVVNVTFLALGWAEASSGSGIAATLPVIEGAGADDRVGRREEVSFTSTGKGVAAPVTICEVIRAAP
jgi:transcriptional regulator with XRE-family HTH domain